MIEKLDSNPLCLARSVSTAPAPSHDNAAPATSAWYHQPVLWLGIAVFAASIAGCVWLIVVSVRYADTPLSSSSHAVFGVPAGAHSAARAPPQPPPDPKP